MVYLFDSALVRMDIVAKGQRRIVFSGTAGLS